MTDNEKLEAIKKVKAIKKVIDNQLLANYAKIREIKEILEV
jgi:hypothetical protein